VAAGILIGSKEIIEEGALIWHYGHRKVTVKSRQIIATTALGCTNGCRKKYQQKTEIY
jgi:hypothetical protein